MEAKDLKLTDSDQMKANKQVANIRNLWFGALLISLDIAEGKGVVLMKHRVKTENQK